MHAIISEAEYRKEIGKTAGKAYLFYGEEDYLKQHAIRLTRERVCPDPTFAVFNDIVIDAVDYSADALLNAMTPPPMMSDGRLILLRGLDLTSMKPAEVDALVETLALLREYDANTVLIYVAAGLIDAGYAKRPSALLKKLSEVAVPVHFEASTPARLAAWGAKHFAHYGAEAAPEVCTMLVSLVGRDMYRLAAEIEKVAYYVLANGRKRVEENDVLTVAIPAFENEAFALSNAIIARDHAAALAALSVLKFERAEPTVVMGEISRTICDMYAAKLMLESGKGKSDICTLLKLHDYKAGLVIRSVSATDKAHLARTIELCAEADRQLKRATGDYAAIEKLICSL